MKKEEMDKLQEENILNLARLIVDTVEYETDVRADKEADDYLPVVTYDELDAREQEAILAAATTIYSKLAYEPFYRYITVEYLNLENEGVEDGS
jgi:hypothetical protein